MIELLSELIAVPSISPTDQNCQAILIKRLNLLGFSCQNLPVGKVSNFWARYGSQSPLIVFAGHTDVVPTGNIEQWHTDPFQATIKGDLLYGRGAADMKGSLAAMMITCQQFIQQHPNFSGSIGWLITSGEEGEDYLDGTPKIMEYLAEHNQTIDYCIVGEPSSQQQLGDTIKVGRRGSLHGNLTIYGQQGHIAYPHLAQNPIHTASPALLELMNQQWDNGNQFFPPTSFQISNIQAGTGATNVIPGQLEVVFNFRFSTESTAEQLKQQVRHLLDKHSFSYDMKWQLSGEPFLTQPEKLIQATNSAVEAITQIKPALSTSGGTSDGRFIAPYGVETIELGPINATIHQVNECVSIQDLTLLSQIYYRILENLLIGSQ